MKKKYRSFAEFYPDYLNEHRNSTCRLLHFLGIWLVLLLVFSSVLFSSPQLLMLVPVAGYGFAWAGHFIYEKNRPATFRFPLYSLLGDWVMFFQIIRGKISLRHNPGNSGRSRPAGSGKGL